MRRALRTSIIATAAVTAAVAVYIALTLPPRAVTLTARPHPQQVSGAYHIHSTQSDGSGTVDEIARAASRAALAFVILTDHGDGTRTPAAPIYRHGVLCIDAIEIGSLDGHIVALGLASASPYPLAGPARDVIEDIHRLGGLAVVAHPDSPKPELRFRAQNAAFDGLEWLNADSEWRDDAGGLLLTATRSLLRPAESIAGLFSRPVRTLQRWDSAARIRPVFGLAALDAHARLGWNDDEEPRRRAIVERPTYEAMFRTVAQTVVLDAPFSGNPSDDAAHLLQAIAAGHSFSVVRALATPATLEFSAAAGSTTAQMGDRLPAGEGIAAFQARVAEAPGARAVLLRDGRQVAAGSGELHYESDLPGVYRVEVFFPGASVPWIASNPIVVEGGGADRTGRGRGGSDGRAGAAPAPEREGPIVPIGDLAWVVERDPRSSGSVGREAGRLEFQYALTTGAPQGQYAALVAPMTLDVGVREIAFVGQASQPMRVSVQARLPGGRDGQRWRRSVYLDETARPIVLRLEDFEPVETPTSRRPVAVPLQSLLFVVDTLNAKPGARGTIWLSDLTVRVETSAPQ